MPGKVRQNPMIRDAIEKILAIAENKTYEINGETYSDKKLIRVEPHSDRPAVYSVRSLDGIIKLVKTELDVMQLPLFIHVCDPRKIAVVSTVDDVMTRDFLYEAICDGPNFKEGFRDQQAAHIELRSRFVQNEGSEYVLDLISRMSSNSEVTTEDNGVTQTITANRGVQLKTRLSVQPRVALIPYRTFREVEQPASEFLLRVNEDGEVGLFEADGGIWQLAAKDSVALYIEINLQAEIAAGKVVVIR